MQNNNIKLPLIKKLSSKMLFIAYLRGRRWKRCEHRHKQGIIIMWIFNFISVFMEAEKLSVLSCAALKRAILDAKNNRAVE